MDKGKIWGLATAVLYLLLWVGLMLWVKFPVRRVAAVEQALLIEFGETETAGGEQDTPLTDDPAQDVSPDAAAPDTPAETSPTGDVAVEQTPAPQARSVDRRALFPGRAGGSTSASQGAATGAGDQGSAAGVADGTSYALAGRNIVGTLPKPAYTSRREGRVAVEIVVAPDGRVVSAAYRATGSTGVDAAMIRDAEAAALKARFTPASAENNQAGVIVYLFRLD